MDLDLALDRTGEVPLGTQLAWKLRDHVASGRLLPGDRLPSLREAAVAAGVNVNTVRAVYTKLEAEGMLHSEQGRGTFVSNRFGEVQARRSLRRDIAMLEARLARHPLPPLGDRRRSDTPTLLSAAELEAVRDELLERLRVLDTQRAELLARLEELDPEPAAPAPEPQRHSTPSLAGARIRWAGA